MTTKKNISFSLLIIFIGLLLCLPLFFNEIFIKTSVGKLWFIIPFFLILIGLLKIESITINPHKLTKTTFILKKTVPLKNITHYKVKHVDLTNFNYYNIGAILDVLIKETKYSKFRFLYIYPKGEKHLKIDERTMSTLDFNMILKEIKKIDSIQVLK